MKAEHVINVANATLSSSMSGWRGTHVRSAYQNREQPPQLLKLYEFEGCPFCKLVREALTELNLEVAVYPCPKGGTRFRPYVVAQGLEQFPYLEDPNTGTALYESVDIVRYLFAEYGGGSVPWAWRKVFDGLNKVTSVGSLALRAGRGVRATGQSRFDVSSLKLLRLYSFESSPYAKPVRERLCELELPFHLINVGRVTLSDYLLPPVRDRVLKQGYQAQGRQRIKLAAEAGRVQVPFLADDNTGVALFESADILDYLDSNYLS